MILNCNCAYPFQDREYGQGRRVHTVKANKTKAKCTVCGKEKGIDGGTPKK